MKEVQKGIAISLFLLHNDWVTNQIRYLTVKMALHTRKVIGNKTRIYIYSDQKWEPIIIEHKCEHMRILWVVWESKEWLRIFTETSTLNDFVVNKLKCILYCYDTCAI